MIIKNIFTAMNIVFKSLKKLEGENFDDDSWKRILEESERCVSSDVKPESAEGKLIRSIYIACIVYMEDKNEENSKTI